MRARTGFGWIDSSATRGALLSLLALLTACGSSGEGTGRDATADSGRPDTAIVDAAMDAATDVVRPTDTGPADTGPVDTGPADTGPADTGPTCTTPGASCGTGLTCSSTNGCTCGNGTVDEGEECDRGAGMNTAGSGCEPSCRYSCHSATDCTGTMPCHGAATCDSATHQCAPGALVAAGTSCGTNMACDAAGNCGACTAGMTCSTTMQCRVAQTDCSSGTPMCMATGNAPMGTACMRTGGASGRCDNAGVCVECVADGDCGAGRICGSGTCTAGCSASSPCPSGQSCCSGACIDTRTNVNNCGACGTVCTAANGTPACTASACTVASCNTGFGNCDGNAANGCEVNTNTSTTHCGSCTTTCSAPTGGTASCSAGACRSSCPSGQTNCGGTCRATGGACMSSGTGGCQTAGTIMCSGSSTACSATAPRTSGACTDPAGGVCNASGTCTLTSVARNFSCQFAVTGNNCDNYRHSAWITATSMTAAIATCRSMVASGDELCNVIDRDGISAMAATTDQSECTGSTGAPTWRPGFCCNFLGTLSCPAAGRTYVCGYALPGYGCDNGRRSAVVGATDLTAANNLCNVMHTAAGSPFTSYSDYCYVLDYTGAASTDPTQCSSVPGSWRTGNSCCNFSGTLSCP